MLVAAWWRTGYHADLAGRMGRTYTEKTIVRSSRTTASSHGNQPIPESIMRLSTKNSGSARRRAAAGLVAVAALLVPAPLASAGEDHSKDRHPVIVLPGAKGAEGIAAGEGSTFFAGDLATG